MGHAYQMDDTDPVRTTDADGGVRVLTLDRPPANAIDLSLLAALTQCLRRAVHDPGVRALVVTGAGRFFCGGFDLRAARRDDEEVLAMVTAYREAHRELLAFPKPTVAMINGHAVAGGLVLALACEHRWAVAGDYRVGLNELAIGAAFPAAAREIVRLRLSDAALTGLVLGADLHPPAALVRFGIAAELHAPERFEDETLGFARRLGAYPSEPYAHTKRELVADALTRLDQATMEEELAIAALWSTDESREARARQRGRL
jgi:enoyl-CoA hydratase